MLSGDRLDRALDRRVDEEPQLVDQRLLEDGVGQRDAAGQDQVAVTGVLQRRTSSSGSPARTVEFCQPGSPSERETTYF